MRGGGTTQFEAHTALIVRMEQLGASGWRKVPGKMAALHAGVCMLPVSLFAGQPYRAAGVVDRVAAATCVSRLHGIAAGRQVILNARSSTCTLHLVFS